MPYFVKHFHISDEDNEIRACGDKAMFERAAVGALGEMVFKKRNFQAKFAFVRQETKNTQDEIER